MTYYKVTRLGDKEGGWMDLPPHIFAAADDAAASAHAKEVWAQWFEDGDWPSYDGQPMRIEGMAEVEGPYLDEDCAVEGPDCGFWVVHPSAETEADHAAMQEEAGLYRHDHEWVVDDPEGFNGVRGGHGTEIHHFTVCHGCGARRTETHRGSNRNPGEASVHWTYIPEEEDYE